MAENRKARTLARWVLERLEDAYGRPAATPRSEPLDELIGTVLSQHTSDVNAERAFKGLKGAFSDWESVRDAPAERVQAAIKSGGLAVVKGQRIQSILRELTNEQGCVTLPDLAALSAEAARTFLIGLPGVGRKTASCVLLFGCGLPAIPVDTHVHRVTRRLGLVPERSSADQACDVLERAVAAADQFSFHVNLIRHGREICKPLRPHCQACVLLERCAYGRRLIGKTRS